jgi:hypothetical protein
MENRLKSEHISANFRPNPERTRKSPYWAGMIEWAENHYHATVPLGILTAALLVGPIATVGDTVADVLLGYAVLPHTAVEVSLRAVRAVQLIYSIQQNKFTFLYSNSVF